MKICLLLNLTLSNLPPACRSLKSKDLRYIRFKMFLFQMFLSLSSIRNCYIFHINSEFSKPGPGHLCSDSERVKSQKRTRLPRIEPPKTNFRTILLEEALCRKNDSSPFNLSPSHPFFQK